MTFEVTKLPTTLSLCFLCACVAVTTSSTSGNTMLQIVWMVPFTKHSDRSYTLDASSSVSALALGLDTAKNVHILNNNYDFNVTVIDSGCDIKQSLGALVDLIYHINIDVVIGPPCAHVVPTIAKLLSYRDIPMINWVSLGQTITEKTLNHDLDTYILTMTPMSSLTGIMANFLITQIKVWQKYVIISNAGADYSTVAQMIDDYLSTHKANNYSVVHHYKKTSFKDLEVIFKQIKHEGRIIILAIPRDDLRKYMLQAHALGMTGGDYQFLYMETKLADMNDVRIIKSDALWKQNDTNDDAARQAFENVLIFVLSVSIQPVSQWKISANKAYDKYFGNRTDVPPRAEPDQFAAYLHDAFVLYADSLNKSLAKNHSRGGRDVFDGASANKFRGLTGDVVINESADRQPAFYLYDLDQNGTFREEASFTFQINLANMKVNVRNSFSQTIRWGDGTMMPHIPRDTPMCGFFDELCPPSQPESDRWLSNAGGKKCIKFGQGLSALLPFYKNYLMIGLASSLPLLVLIPILYIIYRCWRWEKDIRNITWKINPAELDFSLSRRAYAASVRRRLTRSKSFTSHSSVDEAFSRGGESGTSPTPRDQIDVAGSQIFTQIARYNGDIVAVKRSLRKKLTMDRAFFLEMKHMMAMKHGNLTNFIGVCTSPEKVCSVWEYCNKGSLQDVIENDDIRLDTMFKMSMAVDICQGLDYIHKSPLKFHGSLRSSNCVIDNRWVCKLTDFGLRMLKIRQERDEIGEHAYYATLFWTAPEVLRKLIAKESCDGSQEADVYALGVIIKELMCRNETYAAYPDMIPKEIIYKVAYPETEDDMFRPGIQECELGDEYRRQNMEYLVRRCWAEDPDDRPVVKAVLRTINKLNPYKKASVVDNMISLMEKYTNNLEDVVAERTEQLRDEKKKTDELLYRMLPQKVAEDLKFGRAVQAEAFDNVTIYFSDIVHFTALASESSPLQIVEFLNALYTLFDDIIQYYDVYKVETIGDAYMVVSGLPERNGQHHAKEIAGVALDILNNVMHFKIPHDHERQLQIRIGLHTGPVVAGVVGLTMPRYCLFGDTVNTASRMESTGKPLKIHVSSTTRDALHLYSNFTTEDRGEIPVKGKGFMKTYWLTGNYQSGAEMSKKTYHKYIQPDPTTQEHTKDHIPPDSDHTVNALHVPDESECKVSVADSGIVSDKCPEDKDALESGNETRTAWAEHTTIVANDSKDDPKKLKAKRETYVNALIALTEEDTFHARKAWPKISSIDELGGLTSESDDDGLYETVLNHYMEKKRKLSKHTEQADAVDMSPAFDLDHTIEEGVELTNSKSSSKLNTPNAENKRRRKRKKKTDGDERHHHTGKVEIGFFLDVLGGRSKDSDAARFSDGSDSRSRNRAFRSNSCSPRNKIKSESKTSDGHRKTSLFSS